MATTGSKIGSFNGSTANCASLIVEWSYTQDIDKNTTTLTATLKVRRDKSGTSTYKSSTPYSFTVDGTTKSGNYNFNITSISVGSSKTIATISKTLTHNADGTYKAISISGKFDVSGTTLGVGTVSTSLTLNTIPRATTPTVSATSVDMGSSVTFTLNRASNSFTHKLTYAFEGATGTIGTDIGTSKPWTVPDLANKVPNKTSGSCTITCTTYNGTTVIGTKTISMTLKVPSSVKPTVSISVAEAVADVSSKLGKYVKDLSKLEITATGSGASGSTISSYSISANGITYNSSSVTTGLLSTAGSMTIKATVKDSRGRTGSISKIIDIVDYNKPYITTFKVERTTGSNANAVIKGGVTDISGNTPAYTLEYKKKSDETYTEYSLSDTTTTIDKTVTISDIDPDYPYIFRFTVSDQFYSTVLTYEVDTEFALVDFNKSGKSLSLGKVSEDPEKVEINIPLKFCGNILVDLIYPIGSIYISVNDSDPGILFGGTWERIQDKFLMSAGSTYAPGTTGGEATHTLTVDEIPTHQHEPSSDGYGFLTYKADGTAGRIKVASSTSTSARYTHVGTAGATSTSESGLSYNINTSLVGEGKAHNNLPPYLAVYVWKRTS